MYLCWGQLQNPSWAQPIYQTREITKTLLNTTVNSKVANKHV